MANTCFQHKQCHLTTWENTRINPDTGKVMKIRKVLDYILVQNKFKHTMQNARSYLGTLTSSDHRIVIVKVVISWYIVFKNIKNGIKREKLINTIDLVNNDEKKKNTRI